MLQGDFVKSLDIIIVCTIIFEGNKPVGYRDTFAKHAVQFEQQAPHAQLVSRNEDLPCETNPTGSVAWPLHNPA